MKIVTDSAAELTPAEMKEYDVEIVPLMIQFPEGEVASNDIGADDFFNRLTGMVPKVPTTAQPSPGMFEAVYNRLVAQDPEILSVHISSGLSGTSGAARIGADGSDANVTVVDTLTLSGAQRFQVIAAALAAKKGWAKDDILKRLKDIAAKTEIVYTLDTLDYLQRGGRIGRVQGLLGSLLKIKPIINVDKKDGKYTNVGKARSLSKALGTVSDHLAKEFGKTPVWVTILHGQFEAEAKNLEALLDSSLKIAKKETVRVSPALGVHTGPGVVGAAVVPMALMEDLL